MKITAPTMNRGETATVHLREMPFDDWTQELGRQLGAVAVYRSANRTIELIRRDELSKQVFSQKAIPSAFESGFINSRVGDAIRAVASAAQVDLVMPEGLVGMVTADFPNSTWKDAIEGILKATGNRGHVLVDPNGLARITP